MSNDLTPKQTRLLNDLMAAAEMALGPCTPSNLAALRARLGGALAANPTDLRRPRAKSYRSLG